MDERGRCPSLGYTSGQGYHLAVPMPAELVPNFLSGRTKPGDTPWLGELNQVLAEVTERGVPGNVPADLLPHQGRVARLATPALSRDTDG